MRLDSLFQKTPVITSKAQTIQQKDLSEENAFKPGFEIAKF
jgi:hypothetical protein